MTWMTSRSVRPRGPGRGCRAARAAAAFSLIELLVVITIIVLVVGIGLAVMNGLENSAKISATRLTLKACQNIANEYKSQTGNIINHDGPYPGNPADIDWTTPKTYTGTPPSATWIRTGSANSDDGQYPFAASSYHYPWIRDGQKITADLIDDGYLWMPNSTHVGSPSPTVYNWYYDPYSTPPNQIQISCNAYKSIERFVWAAMQNARTREMVLALGPNVLLERNKLPPSQYDNPNGRDAGFLNIVDAWGKPLQYRDHSDGSGTDRFPAFPAYNMPFFASAGRDGKFGFRYDSGQEYCGERFYGTGNAAFMKDNLYSYEVK